MWLLCMRGARVDFEFAAAQLSPKMLAQRLLVDLELIGDFGLGDANGRSSQRARAVRQSAQARVRDRESAARVIPQS